MLGLGGLLIGSRLVVIGAMDVAHALGVPAALISLTLVAFGTSLPELAACITAARRGESEIGMRGQRAEADERLEAGKRGTERQWHCH